MPSSHETTLFRGKSSKKKKKKKIQYRNESTEKIIGWLVKNRTFRAMKKALVDLSMTG